MVFLRVAYIPRKRVQFPMLVLRTPVGLVPAGRVYDKAL